MLTKEGTNDKGSTFYKLQVPKEAIEAGLEVGVEINNQGIRIGDGVLSWAEIKEGSLAAGVKQL